MAQEIVGHTETFISAADLSANNNRWVKLSAENTVAQATADTDAIVGVQHDIPYAAVGAQVAVVLSGTPKIMAGAAFSAGAFLTTDGSGRAITAVSTKRFHGVAIQAAAAAGDIVQIDLNAKGTV